MRLPTIRTFPDPILKQPTHRVERLDDTAQQLIEDLIATMRRNRRCVGLAAPQIGGALRVAVMDASLHPHTTTSQGLLVLVNPVIEHAEGVHLGREGCLSIPDFTVNVRRASRVCVRAQDRSGVLMELWLDGFEAIIAQHEIDHLDGTLFLDRVASLATDVFRRKTYG